ncbi:hypothetical protein T06_7890 [Trichinella sp. T6]|nr:hypothetical protein T06_7890 [Trichinella sp. T6]
MFSDESDNRNPSNYEGVEENQCQELLNTRMANKHVLVNSYAA